MKSSQFILDVHRPSLRHSVSLSRRTGEGRGEGQDAGAAREKGLYRNEPASSRMAEPSPLIPLPSDGRGDGMRVVSPSQVPRFDKGARTVSLSRRTGEGRDEANSLPHLRFGLCLALLALPLIASPAEDTNSPAVSNAATNVAPVSAIDTNAAPKNAKDTAPSKPGATATNSPGLSNAEPKATLSKSPASASRVDLEAFSVIWERNIFNPNRRGRSRSFVAAEPDKRVRTETFSLVGTMSYEKGSFAFFDGSSSEYQKVIQSTGSIANYKVTAIAPNHVKLEGTNGQALELAVGGLMKKVEEGDWTLAMVHSSANVSAEDADAALKRLLQKREQEAGGESSASSETPAPAEEKTDKPEKIEKSDAGTDDVLKKLLQKREQELNK